uniref:(northern house mosquito) hypothetical protein n=2 Tax=Culex pipiens TaxID=7175 RepID=A0A8D8CZF7_CULPI
MTLQVPLECRSMEQIPKTVTALQVFANDEPSPCCSPEMPLGTTMTCSKTILLGVEMIPAGFTTGYSRAMTEHRGVRSASHRNWPREPQHANRVPSGLSPPERGSLEHAGWTAVALQVPS